MAQRREVVYTPEFKRAAARDVVEGGRQISEVAGSVGVAEPVLAKWVEAYRELFLAAADPSDVGSRPDMAFPAAGPLEASEDDRRIPGNTAAEPRAGDDDADELNLWLLCLRDPLLRWSSGWRLSRRSCARSGRHRSGRRLCSPRF
jgi:transposase-like protein